MNAGAGAGAGGKGNKPPDNRPAANRFYNLKSGPLSDSVIENMQKFRERVEKEMESVMEMYKKINTLTQTFFKRDELREKYTKSLEIFKNQKASLVALGDKIRGMPENAAVHRNVGRFFVMEPVISSIGPTPRFEGALAEYVKTIRLLEQSLMTLDTIKPPLPLMGEPVKYGGRRTRRNKRNTKTKTKRKTAAKRKSRR